MTRKENTQLLRKKLAALVPGGLSRREMEQELRSLAQGYADILGEPISVPSLKEMEKIPLKKLAQNLLEETPEPKLLDLLKAYNAEEKRMTLDYKNKFEGLNEELKGGLVDIKDWAVKELKKPGASKLEVSRKGDVKLQSFKNKMSNKNHSLKMKAFKDFNKLEMDYKKKDPKFEEALQRQRKNWKLLKFSGKVFIGMTSAFLFSILLGLAIKFIILSIFVQKLVPAAAESLTDAVVDTTKDSLSQVLRG